MWNIWGCTIILILKILCFMPTEDKYVWLKNTYEMSKCITVFLKYLHNWYYRCLLPSYFYLSGHYNWPFMPQFKCHWDSSTSLKQIKSLALPNKMMYRIFAGMPSFFINYVNQHVWRDIGEAYEKYYHGTRGLLFLLFEKPPSTSDTSE